jgi:CRP-like cAMP-binding protein
VDAFEGVRLTPGQCVYTEGCDASYIYIMQTGQLSIFIEEAITKRSIPISKETKAGQIFGDSEFMKVELQAAVGLNESFSNGKLQYNIPGRSHTIKASEDSLLWRIPGQVFLDLVTRKLSIDLLEKRTFVHSLTVLNVKIRDKFVLSTFSELLSSLVQMDYSAGEVIATIGQTAEYIHIIYKGIVSIDSTSRRLGSGEIIGDDCVIDNKAYSHTFYALESHVTCLLLPRHLFLLYFFDIDSGVSGLGLSHPNNNNNHENSDIQVGLGRVSQVTQVSSLSATSHPTVSTYVSASALATNPISRLNSKDVYDGMANGNCNGSTSTHDNYQQDTSGLHPTNNISSDLRESFTSNLSSSRSLTATSPRSLKSILTTSPRPTQPPAPETDANPKTKKKVAIKIESLSLGDSLRKALQFSGYKRTSPMKATSNSSSSSSTPNKNNNNSTNNTTMSISPVRSLADSPVRYSKSTSDGGGQTLNESIDELDSPGQPVDKGSSSSSSNENRIFTSSSGGDNSSRLAGMNNITMRTSREALLTGRTDSGGGGGWMTGRSTTSYMNTARSSIDNSDYRALGAR